MKIISLSFFVILALVSCSTSLRDDQPAQGYILGKLPSPKWTQIKTDEKGKHFFQNQESGSAVGVDSVCKRYQESTLETLSKTLVHPIEKQEITSQKRIQMDDREAVETRAIGSVDGIWVEAVFVVFRKNACIFDFSLISRGKISSSDEADFKKFVANFRYEGGR